jgi:hypothetical protein
MARESVGVTEVPAAGSALPPDEYDESGSYGVLRLVAVTLLCGLVGWLTLAGILVMSVVR